MDGAGLNHGFFPGLDKSLGASCKDSIGWMFSKLDTSADLFLDQMELAAINLDKYEVCIRPFFNSCDTYKDGRVSTAEWCFCFWRESECGPLPWPQPCCECSAPRFRLFGVPGGSLLPPPQARTFPAPLLPAPCFLHSQQLTCWSPGKPALSSLPLQAPGWVLWVLKLTHLERPSLRKSIKNCKCKLSG